MVKKTTDNIVAAFRLINAAKLTKMEDKEKFSLLKAVRTLKKIATDFEDYLKDVQTKLKPDGFDAIISKVQSKTDLTMEESKALNDYNKSVSECVKEELDKEVELLFTPLTDDAMAHFFASNDFSVSEMLLISDVIGE